MENRWTWGESRRKNENTRNPCIEYSHARLKSRTKLYLFLILNQLSYHGNSSRFKSWFYFILFHALHYILHLICLGGHIVLKEYNVCIPIFKWK